MSKEKLAWAAGFMDGEGCTFFRSTAARARTISLSVTQAANPDVLYRMQDALGAGSIHKKTHVTVSGKSVWEFRLTSFDDVTTSLAMMWPWLGPVKRAQADKAIRSYVDRAPVKRTQCKNGHDYDSKTRTSRGWRQCLICEREYSRQARQRHAQRENLNGEK